jgi:hypothetical protein
MKVTQAGSRAELKKRYDIECAAAQIRQAGRARAQRSVSE